MKNKQTEKTLSPCPCCGGEPDLRAWSVVEEYFAMCKKCELRTPEYKTKAKAIAAWNKRYSPELQQARTDIAWLTQVAYEAGHCSAMRAAELLGLGIAEIMRKTETGEWKLP